MIFDLLAPPQGPRRRGPKNCTVACVIDVSNSHTKSGWIWGKKFLSHPPPIVPPSPTPGAWPRRPNENPVWYGLYLSFVRRHTKFGLKIFEIDFVIEILWYLTFWPRPRGRGPKYCAVACAIDVSNSHTKSGWISKKKIWTTQPPTVPPSPTPGAWPRRLNKNPVWYVLFLSFVRRLTKFGLKIFEIDFVI